MGWLNWLFVDLSRIGTDGLVFVVVALFLAALWRRPWIFVLVAGADAAGSLLSWGLRQWIGRDRPPLVYHDPKPLVSTPHSGAFPSGHATAAFACATALAWAVPRLAAPAFVLAAAIAWSRVYVGVHWPLDVLGGAALGAGVATTLLMLAGFLQRSRQERRAG